MRLYQIQIGTGANHYVHLYSINAGFPLAAPRAWEALGSRKVVFFCRFEPSLEDCWFCWIPRIAEVAT